MTWSAYLERHRDHIDAANYKARGLSIGRGMVARAGKGRLPPRGTGGGRRGSEEGFNHLFHLRLAWVNGPFEAWFQVEVQASPKTERRPWETAGWNQNSHDLRRFLQKNFPVTMQQPVGSEYLTWVRQDGAPSGAQPPALLSCLTRSPVDLPYGATSPPDGGASRAYAWPIPSSSPQRPPSSRSRAPPNDPSTAQSDDICCGRAGKTVTEWAYQGGPHRAPSEADTVDAPPYCQGHAPCCSVTTLPRPARARPWLATWRRASQPEQHWFWRTCHRE
jgi:hypothetical protein